MARDTSSGNYLSVNHATLSFPLGFTVGCFVVPDVNSGCLTGNYGGGGNWILNMSTGGVYFYNGAWSTVWGSGTTTVGTRGHFAAVYRGAGSEAVLNGAALGTNDVGANVGAGTVQVGRRPDGADPFDGKMCEVAIWAATLNAAELRGIGRGVSPLVTRPLALRTYWPLWGTCAPEVDLSKAKAHIAIVGTVPAIRHFGGSPMAL